MEPITAKVARILNRRELVLNVGSKDLVVVGMKFAILNPRGAKINDPDTQEELGSVQVPKVLVEAVRVKERLTVARTFKSRQINVGGQAPSAAALFSFLQPPKYEKVLETLQTDESAYQEELDEKDSYVKIGDPAVQIIGEEFE